MIERPIASRYNKNKGVHLRIKGNKYWTVKSYILCKFVLVSGDGLMHFSYFLLKAIDFRA